MQESQRAWPPPASLALRVMSEVCLALPSPVQVQVLPEVSALVCISVSVEAW